MTNGNPITVKCKNVDPCKPLLYCILSKTQK